MKILSSCLILFILAVSIDVYAEPGMIKIPSGKFIMGSNAVDEKNHWKQYGSREPWFMNEHPQRQITLPAYYIDTYEVTNKQYKEYVLKTSARIPKYWLDNGFAFSLKDVRVQQMSLDELRRLGVNVFKFDVDVNKLSSNKLLEMIRQLWQEMETLPVTHVSWHEANKYCYAQKKRLPTEAEWEKAARGENGREFVTGNEWRAGASNVGEETWPFGVAPIGSYPEDKSIYGVYDLAGNAYEWVADWYKPYSGSTYSAPAFGETHKVIRGSGFGKNGHYFLIHYQRAAYRSYLLPDDVKPGQGFRCAKNA